MPRSSSSLHKHGQHAGILSHARAFRIMLGLMICLIPSLDSDHPKYIVSDLENHTVVTDAESVCMRAGERFSELKRIRLLGVKAHLGGDALLSLAG
jgi:hypothetical protein